ncbi:MAG: hypothetical protein GXO22_04330 [Aquificae bacterium]|nr:hypothetical protein [Aquificota bacterium]
MIKFETLGATINIVKEPDGRYTAYIYWKNPECEAEICKKTIMPAYKIDDCKFRLDNGYILNQCEQTTEVEPIDIEKEISEQLPIADKIALKIDENVFRPVKNFTKTIENTSKNIALVGILGAIAFLYLAVKK